MTEALANVAIPVEARAISEPAVEVLASVETPAVAFADASPPVEASANAGALTEAAANVEGEAIIVDFATQFPDAQPDDAIRVDATGEFVVTRDEPLAVDNLPGVDFNAQWENARTKVATYNAIRDIQLPDFTSQLTGPLIMSDPGTPASESQLWRGITVRGGRDTILIWAESVVANSNLYMMDIPAAFSFKLENIKFKNVKGSAFTTPIPGLRAINHRAGWEYNANTARNIQFERLTFELFDECVYVGDPGGPDITNTTWQNCSTITCKNGWTIEGGNIATYTFDGCQVGASFTTGNANGWHLKTVVPYYFDGNPANHQYLDSWGDPVAWNWTESGQWLRMLRDSEGRNGEHPDFDSDTARTPGGAPDIEIRNSTGTMNADIGGVPSYMIVSDSAPVKVYDFRLEGTDAAFCDIRGITFEPGDSAILNFGKNRLTCIFTNVTTAGGTHPPYQIENVAGLNAGYPVMIEGGYYTNETLPAEDLSNPQTLVMWQGLIRGPSGTLFADGRSFTNP